MKAEVTFTVEVPNIGTEEQLEEWIEFEMGIRGCCSKDNPYVNQKFKPENLYLNI